MIPLNWLKMYYELGFTILPVKEGDKRPCIKWERWQTETPPWEQIQEWYDKKLFGNVAIVLKNFFAIDIDDPNLSPHPRSKNLLQMNIDKIIDAGHAVNITSGYKAHIIGRDTSGLGPMKLDQHGIDFRTGSEYIVVPPSKHPSGWFYHFYGCGDPNTPPEKQDLDRARVMLTKILPQPHEKLWKDMVGKVSELKDLENPYEKIVKKDDEDKFPPCITKVMYGVVSGMRNEAIYGLTSYFKQRNLPKKIAYELVKETNRNSQPPLSEKEVKTTFESAWKSDKHTGCYHWQTMSMCSYENQYECPFFYERKPKYNLKYGTLLVPIQNGGIVISRRGKEFFYRLYYKGKSRGNTSSNSKLWERIGKNSNLYSWLKTWYKPETINDIVIKSRATYPEVWDDFIFGGVIQQIVENIDSVEILLFSQAPMTIRIKVKGGGTMLLNENTIQNLHHFIAAWLKAVVDPERRILPFNLTRNDYIDLVQRIFTMAKEVYRAPDEETEAETAGNRFASMIKEFLIKPAKKDIVKRYYNSGNIVFYEKNPVLCCLPDIGPENGGIIYVPTELRRRFCEKEYQGKITLNILSKQLDDYKIRDKNGLVYPSQQIKVAGERLRFLLLSAEKLGITEDMVQPEEEEE